MGTPDLDVYVGACLPRSCGLSSIPVTSPAFLKTILAAAYVIGKILWSVRLNRPVLHVRPQTVYHLTKNEHDLNVLATLCALDRKFLVICISGGELQDFADSHAASGHELQDQPVSDFRRSEDDLIHGLLFDNIPEDGLPGPVDFPQHRDIARILDGRIEVDPDEIEEGLLRWE